MPAHPPITLAQAIERVVNIENAGAPFAGLSDAITDLARARARLDGLEEFRAILDLREKAYERALELERRSGPGAANPNRANLTRHDRTLELARFLAPAWADLEDPLGPTETRAELEASQAATEALADQLRDDLERRDLIITELTAAVRDRTIDRENYAARIEELERQLNERNEGYVDLTWGDYVAHVPAPLAKPLTELLEHNAGLTTELETPSSPQHHDGPK